jgi:hypothetical protein
MERFVLALTTLVLLGVVAHAFPAPSLAQAWPIETAPPSVALSYASVEEPTLTAAQRLSIEHGASDLAGAAEGSVLATALYVTSAATLVGGVATVLVLFTELAPPFDGVPWGNAEWAVLGSAIACFVAHGAATSVAITNDVGARRRRERARRELLLTEVVLTPLGVSGRF